MSTSAGTKEAWTAALDGALSELKSLLATGKSKSWRSIPANDVSIALTNAKGKARESSTASPTIGDLCGEIQVHRKPAKAADVVRATAEFYVTKEAQIQDFQAVLATPEARPLWDRMVDHALLEDVMPQNVVSKTCFRLGWPASPRDAVTISRTFGDASTLLHVATSLPRSPDEPAYLRPSPPYVRSHVHLFAICIQLPSTFTGGDKGRIQVFSRWQLKGMVPNNSPAELAPLLAGLLDCTRSTGHTLPYLSSFGKGIEVTSVNYKAQDEQLSLEYAVIAEDAVDAAEESATKGLDALLALKERRRLERSLEIPLPVSQGWDVQVSLTGHGVSTPNSTWHASAGRVPDSRRAIWRITHDPLDSPDRVIRVTLHFRRLAGGKIIRVNSMPLNVDVIEPRDPISHTQRMLVDSTQANGNSSQFETSTSSSSQGDGTSQSKNTAQEQITTSIRRSYTYFASLLQEPEAKWRHVTETRGVSVSQLNSIDPTVTIYRAVATFVGVGVWDLYATVQSPGARLFWDKSLDEVILLDDVDELSSLWYARFKSVWPAWCVFLGCPLDNLKKLLSRARDSALLRTAYKSPTSVHIFSFSVEDSQLYDSIPPLPPSTIRSNVAIQGWSIEALSPTTTQVTLIEQSDLRGWSNKSWTYQQMVNSVGGVGDYTIKHGAPPVVTRILGAKVTTSTYNHDKGSFKLECHALQPSIEKGESKVGEAAPLTNGLVATKASKADATKPMIECELRCDVEVWSSSLDIVTDPPPTRVSVLSRHRLSSSGGCWVTIEYDSAALASDKMMVLVRRGANSRSKGSVYVNGAKTTVDSESLPEDQVKALSQQKRIKVSPVPLDHWPSSGQLLSRSASPRVSSLDLTAAVSDRASGPPTPASIREDADRPCMSFALDALALLQAFHAVQGPELSSPVPGWTTISEKGGYLRKRIVSSLSPLYPVFRGEKVVQDLSAEQLLEHIVNPGARMKWDTKLDSCQTLESFGNGFSTSLQVTKPAFLTFRNRLFHIATINSHIRIPSASASSSTSQIYLIASASCPFTANFPYESINPQSYPVGQLLFEGWLLETVDPYASQTFAIPSTRVSHFSCVNWGGAVPQALGSMVNPSPLKVIDAVANQARISISPPRLLVPANTAQVEGPLASDNVDECEWVLNTSFKRREPTYLRSTFSPESSHFTYTLLIPKLDAPASGTAKAHNRATSVPHSSGTKSTPSIRSRASLANIQQSPRIDEGPSDFGTPSSFTPPNSLASSIPSMPSMPSMTTLSNLSPSKSRTTKAQDYVVAEIIFDARPGFHLCDLTAVSRDTDTPPFDLNGAGKVLDLPLRVSLHDMPQSGMSTSLSTAPQRLYMLRFTLPTAQYMAPVNDPLRDGARKSTPDWLKVLQARPVMLDIELQGSSDEAGTPVAEDKRALKPKVLYQGRELPLVSERESRSIFEQHANEEWAVRAAHLSRVPRRLPPFNADLVDGLPVGLRQPIAIARSPVPLRNAAIEPSAASPAESETTPRADRSNSLQTPSLSRKQSVEPDEAGDKEASALSSVLTSYPFTLAKEAFAPSVPTDRRQYSLRFLIVVAIVSFLLGSLLRSLLTPADFILYPREASGQVDMALLQALDSKRRWKQARRLVEARTPFGHDFIVAAVRHG